MLSNLKTYLRDSLPTKYQVPIKYWYGWARRSLEPEMKLLSLVVKSNALVIDIDRTLSHFLAEKKLHKSKKKKIIEIIKKISDKKSLDKYLMKPDKLFMNYSTLYILVDRFRVPVKNLFLV